MRFLAGLVFAAIVVCGIDLRFVRELADFRPGTTLQYDRFLREVARRTPPGASVAIHVSTRRFEPDYAYYYYRAVYQLPGRRAIPLKDPDDRDHPERLADVEYIAAWASATPLPHQRVWSGNHGTLYRRAR
ncbi:MAG TPA: hypothetical protein VF432_25070 [Thermoanaerobaculia bacterium]